MTILAASLMALRSYANARVLRFVALRCALCNKKALDGYPVSA